MSTHLISVDAERGVVTKRFRSRERGEPEREWAALTVLTESDPGLSPAPLRAELATEPPLIEMSWVQGRPLGGSPLTDAHAIALAQALQRLWDATSRSKITEWFGPTPNSSAFIDQIRSLLAAEQPGQNSRTNSRVVGHAVRSGTRWLDQSQLERLAGIDVVLGHGDPNLANYLWDEDRNRVRIVDFEDSGPSHRAFELAILVEHRSAWAESALDAAAFAKLFDLSEPELIVFGEFRRLAALFWLLKVESALATNHRYGPDTLDRQAQRLLSLLG